MIMKKHLAGIAAAAMVAGLAAAPSSAAIIKGIQPVVSSGFERFGAFAIRVDKIGTAQDGNYQAVVTVRNIAERERNLTAGGIWLTLYSGNSSDLPRRSIGNLYEASVEGPLKSLKGVNHTIRLQPNEEAQVRFAWADTIGFSPVKLRIRDQTWDVAEVLYQISGSNLAATSMSGAANKPQPRSTTPAILATTNSPTKPYTNNAGAAVATPVTSTAGTGASLNGAKKPVPTKIGFGPKKPVTTPSAPLSGTPGSSSPSYPPVSPPAPPAPSTSGGSTGGSTTGSASLIGDWRTGSASTVDMYNPSTGKFITAPDGNGSVIRFTANGYVQAGYSALSMSCATRIIYWKKGTYTVQGNQLTFRPTDSVRRMEDCTGKVTEKKGWAETETVPYRISGNTLTWTDQYGSESSYDRK